MPRVHGGNIYEAAALLGCEPEDILDFSASINPLSAPVGLFTRFNKSWNRLRHYPDIHNQELTGAIAAFHGVAPERVAAGNGSTELLYWLPKALRCSRAVIALPTFGEYVRAFEVQGVAMRAVHALPENGYQPTIGQIEEALAGFRPDAVLITHPGSPSGTLLPRQVREWLIAKCADDNVVCMVDEAFTDFCEEESFKEFLHGDRPLVLIRSMTKFYGIPGLRLGYVLASEAIARRLRQCLPPWGVNTMAQIAGCYCLEQTVYRDKTLELMDQERPRMAAALASIEGIEVFPGVANYLMARLDNSLPAAAELRDDLVRSHRIMVRDCASFGVGDRCVRVAIRLPDENDRLISALSAWVESRHRDRTREPAAVMV